jgi:hypothetical protein
VSTLERELVALAAYAFPETPDLAAVVRARIEREPRREPWWRGRRTLVLALAVLVAAVGAAFAVPQARSTILRWLGIGGVRVQFVDQLPTVPTNRTPIIGVPVSLDQARARVGFRVLVPVGQLGPPDAVYVGHFSVDEVTLLYGSPTKIRLLLTEVDGSLSIPVAAKFVIGNRHVRRLTIGGKPALWIEGAPHEFLFIAPNGQVVSAPLRLDKNTLLWQRGRVLLRLEGDLSLAQALRVARSLR